MSLATIDRGKVSLFFIITAVILLSIAPLSFADIIYTSAEPNGVSSFTVDGSTLQFQSQSNVQCLAWQGHSAQECIAFAATSSVSAVGVSVLGDEIADNLPAGEAVGSGKDFNSDGELLWLEEDPGGGYGIDGSWRGPGDPNDPNPGYLGFRIQASDGYHYGWVLAEVGGGLPDPSDPTAGLNAVALDYAYESCPNQAIAAGATSGGASCNDPPDPASEPATATLLVVGLAGFELFYRRRLKSSLCMKLE